MNLATCSMGLELGSTRIKSVLLNETNEILAIGTFDWENRLQDGIWTYDLEDVTKGVQSCFASLKANFEKKYATPLTTLGAIGISGMMHGFLAFDENMKLLTPFRTWRNTVTAEAAKQLSAAFDFNVPQRWSIAHLYQDILEGKPYVSDIRYFTTLSGYVHYLLTGEKVLGIGDASGMFPIDPNTADYCTPYVDIFNHLCAEKGIQMDVKALLPKVLPAGVKAGALTEKGARLLDPSATLSADIPLVAPEGDGPTGMVATNSVRVGTGNVSAGTSVFAMIVTDQPIGNHREIDIITTPDGKNVAMAHCNNCTSDINAYVKLFHEFAALIGSDISLGDTFTALFEKSMEGADDCGGIVSFNYLSGEGITDLDEGKPMLLRAPDAPFRLADFMKTQIYSCFATLRLGVDILTRENIHIDSLIAHGGIFTTPLVAQTALSAALRCPITVMKCSSEGGPYGMALLAAYLLHGGTATLPDYLDTVFSAIESHTLTATAAQCDGFEAFLQNYLAALPAEALAATTQLQ